MRNIFLHRISSIVLCTLIFKLIHSLHTHTSTITISGFFTELSSPKQLPQGLHWLQFLMCVCIFLHTDNKGSTTALPGGNHSNHSMIDLCFYTICIFNLQLYLGSLNRCGVGNWGHLGVSPAAQLFFLSDALLCTVFSIVILGAINICWCTYLCIILLGKINLN